MTVWSWLKGLKQRGVPDGVRVVGWGPFPMPTCLARHRESAAYAEQMMAALEVLRQEGEEPSALEIVQAQLRAVRQEFQGVATENTRLRQERDAYRQIANLAIDSMNRLAGYDTNYAGSDRGDG